MRYIEAIQRGMEYLASKDDVIWVGQGLKYNAHAISKQVKKLNLPPNKIIEFPVAENMQAGFCLGMSLCKFVPVCIYPRFDFALLAFDQLINHIDKWSLMVPGAEVPRIIIKIQVGYDKPLDPGFQHKGNYTEAIKKMVQTLHVYDTKDNFNNIEEIYINSYKFSGIIIEYAEFYEYNI